MRSGWRWAAVAAVLACTTGPGWAASPAPKPVVTNKLRFRIPFRFDAAALQRMNARELQLYVSRDRGATWNLGQTISPQSSKFEFQAAGDGEYWFSVKTLDGFGELHPPGQTYDTGLVVIVDTAQPRLDLQLQQLSPGKIQLSWQAQDPNLDPSTLRLEYLQPGNADWQPVSIVPRNTGQTTWTVSQAGVVAVRGSIGDLASNTATAQAQVQVAAAAEGGLPGPPPDLRQPIASTEQKLSSTIELPPLESAEPPARKALPAPTAVPVIRPQPGTAAAGRFISESPAARPDITQERWPAGEPSAPAPAGRQRIVGTRRFQLGYKVEDVGPSGVGAVELFITQDHGRKWWKYGDDADRTSPIDVEVPQDGEYGFCIRVRSGAGLASEPPLPGEPPSISVVVDQTPPRLELLPIQQGQGSEINQLHIRWRTSDQHPAEKSIALYYAPTPNGPWESIGGWRQDTGSYQWAVGPGAPAQFYIRVLARDAAGNVSRAETPQPILVDLSRPTARIVDVEATPSPGPQ